MARPSKYREEFAEQAAKLCALGATDAELADFFEVAISTVALWKVVHPEFSDALRAAKSIADERVEQSLYRRAVGYEHDEIDIRVVGGEVVQTPIRRRYPPDATSMIFWLKNRKPEQWRDRPNEADSNETPPPVRIEVTVRDASIRADAEHAASTVPDA